MLTTVKVHWLDGKRLYEPRNSDFSTTNIVYSYARHEQHVHVLLCPHQPRCSELQQFLSYPRTTVEWNAVHAADHQDRCGMEPPCNAAVQAQSVNHTHSSSSLLLLPPCISIGHPRVRALPTPLRQCQRTRCKQCTVHQLQETGGSNHTGNCEHFLLLLCPADPSPAPIR